MKPILFYLLQVIAASGLLYGYYHFALRNKKFHRYNRFYLLMTVLISSFIPFLNIPVYFSQQEASSSIMLQTLQVLSSPSDSHEISAVSSVIQDEPATATWFTAEHIMYLLYLLILAFFLVRVLISLGKIRSIIKRNSVEQLDKIKFINTDEPGTPFSFFRWLFWNRKIELQSERGEQIFRHELFHIQQKHSWDTIFVELASTILWINPFIHLIKKEIKAIHEFLADEFAIKENKNWQYAELLLMQAFNTNIKLVNPFFHNQIKRRIAMITTSQKPSYRYTRKLMVLPVAAIIILLFAFNYKNRQSDPHEFEKAINSITVVVDAGHGGTDKGAKTRDGKYNEAELSLAIAKKIETLGPEYNINVIMTRIDEKFPGDAADKNDALRKRVEMVNNLKPHALIAIHMNTTSDNQQSTKSGFDAYVTNQKYNLPDVQLASSVLGELKKIYTTNQDIRQRGNASIYVLDRSNYPSLLLECGYINNPKDISFVTNEGNQEKIAKAILKGLVAFANGTTTDQRSQLRRNVADTSKLLQNALVVINGVVQEKRGLQNIDTTKFPNKEFKGSINVFGEKEAVAKYGEEGKHGAIEFSYDHYNHIIDTIPKVDTIYWIKNPQPPAKRPPTKAELTSWEDSKKYGVWLDGKKILNSDLSEYNPSDFSLVQVSKLAKNAVNYGKYYYQVDLYTHKYYGKIYMNATSRKPYLVREIALSKNMTKLPQLLLVINGDPLPGLTMETVKKSLPEKSVVTQTILNEQDAEKKYGEKGKYGAVELTAKYWDENMRSMTMYHSDAMRPVDKPVSDDNKVFVKMEVEPSFPGGHIEWKKFLESNLDVNITVKNRAKEGKYTVVVQFIVDKDGNISDVRALTNHGYGMEEEAVRMIQKSPHWIPGMQNGRKIKGYRKQPITFVIPDSRISVVKYSDNPVYAYLINSGEGTTINLDDFKKVKQLKLAKADSHPDCELISFKITIDKPDPDKFSKVFVIKGNNFPGELLKIINDQDSETFIIIEDIDVKIDGQNKRLVPRIYKAVSMATTPG